MKKLVLVTVSVIIMAIFIAFNYLLWDKQNSQEMYDELNASKKAGIDALSREVQDLTDTNKKLQDQINQLEQESLNLKNSNSELQDEVSALHQKVEDRNVTIHALIPQVDPKPLEDTVNKWAQGIDTGDYETAYNLQLPQLLKQSQVPDLKGYSAGLKNTIKSFKVKSIEMKNDGLPDSRRGSVVLKVVLDIKKSGEAETSDYAEGLNERYLTMSYNMGSKCWNIADISAYI